MQDLSLFNPQGATLATPHLDSGINSSFILRRRRKKSSPFGNSRCSENFCSSSSSCFFRNQNQNPRHGFLFCGLKLNIYGPKMGSLGRSVALALALEQEPVGCEHVKELTDSEESESQTVSWNAVNGVESDEIVDTEGGEQAQVAELEVVAERNAIELIEKERVDVRALSSSLQGAKTADDVEEVLKNLEDLPLPVYSSIIRAFGFEKRLEPAFALVEWLKRKRQESNGAVGPNLFIYNSLLGAVKQAEQFEKIDGVIGEMKSEGMLPNIVTYNTLMSVHLEQGRSNEALAVLDDIEKIGLSLSPVTYSTILLAYRETENAKGAIDFFVKLREKYEKGEIGEDKDYDWDAEFVKLEKFTVRICYLLMRRFLVRGDNPSTNVFKVLSDMDKAMIKIGRAECERLIWACTREGHYTVARELYSRIREMDSDISLSVCNHVIWLMGKAKKWWAALEIYEDLLDKGPKPNNLSYELIISHFNILLTAARRKGIWRWGVRLINKMLEKGLRPGTGEWNAVLVACSKASETSAAVEIFRRMVEQGEKPTILSYGALLSALEKGKLYDEALRVWEHMCKVGVKPNLHAYTILASIHIGNERPEMVDSVLKEMAEAKIQPTVVTFNAIITGCTKNQMGGAAFEWFHRMKVQNIKPNDITYDMLIEALARDGKPRLAYGMYLQSQNEGLHPSSRAYDAVVEACRYYNTSLNMDALGSRPLEKHKVLKIRKKLSDFCNLADVPRRGNLHSN
nr:pentatricopeptide repeat protein AaPPR496 [Agave angustifolia]